MPPTRRDRQVTTERACFECQKRKTKCIVTGSASSTQTCTYCTKAGKTCIFVQPSHRTPLTRQSLDDAEARCARLEALLLQQQRGDSIAAASDTNLSPTASKIQSQDAHVNAPFEWSEIDDQPLNHEGDDEHGELHDGMAALGDISKGAGYLGDSSGHEMLQSVSSLLPEPRDNASATLATPTSSTVHDFLGASLAATTILSTAAVEEQLINAYFLGYNAYYPVLHENSFRERCAQRRFISQRSSWHMVYYAVLAIGEWVAGCGGSRITSIYHDAARSRLTPEVLESGSIDTVQAFLLLGNYLQKRDRPNTGYNYIGIAVRMAMGLGLHRELPASSQATPMERHRRRVLYWLLYCFDCWFNITTGRPALVSDTSCNVIIPRNVDETASSPVSESAVEAPFPTTCSSTIALARLTKIANRIYSQLMSGSQAPDTVTHHTTVMVQMLNDWQAALPAYFTSEDGPEWFLGPRQIILWKKSNLTIVLLLSSQKHQVDDHERVAIGTRCSKVASDAITNIAWFCQHRGRLLHRGLSWYAVYFILQATLSLSAQFVYRRRSASTWHDDDWRAFDETLAKSIQCLQLLAAQSPAAARSLQLVAQLYDRAKQSVIKTACAELSPTTAQGILLQSTQVPTALNTVNWAAQTTAEFPMSSHSRPYVEQARCRTYLPEADNDMSLPLDGDMLMPEMMLDEWASTVDESLYSFLDGLDAPFHGICQ